MNYTTNYHLPQWVESDRILMGDFNDAMAGIEAGLGSNAQAAAAAQTTAETADSKADATQATASAAQSTADNAYCPSNKPYVLGTYMGTGSRQTIDIGFKPSAILISGNLYDSDSEEVGRHICFARQNASQWNGNFINTGIELYNTNSYPKTNANGRTYHYIAFR